MEQAVPWRELESVIEPYYPKPGNGRQPVGLSIMLRVYFLQQWFNLSDPGAEDALYESAGVRALSGGVLGRAAGPGGATRADAGARRAIAEGVAADGVRMGIGLASGPGVSGSVGPGPRRWAAAGGAPRR